MRTELEIPTLTGASSSPDPSSFAVGNGLPKENNDHNEMSEDYTSKGIRTFTSQEALQEELEMSLREGSINTTLVPCLNERQVNDKAKGRSGGDGTIKRGESKRGRSSSSSLSCDAELVELPLFMMGHFILQTHSIPRLNTPPNHTTAMWFWGAYNLLTTFHCGSFVRVITRNDFNWEKDVGFEFFGAGLTLILCVVLDVIMVVTIISAIPD